MEYVTQTDRSENQVSASYYRRISAISEVAAPPAQKSSAEAEKPIERSLSFSKNQEEQRHAGIQSTARHGRNPVNFHDGSGCRRYQGRPRQAEPAGSHCTQKHTNGIISKQPNRPQTSLGEEIKLFASTISYAYVAGRYELIKQDRQVKTLLGLLSEVPGHSTSASSKGQRKLKRKPLQFVIPNPAKTITIQNGFVASHPAHI
ncbi:unnamed protein product [Bursaphelenchus xylophilus]|uniref:(pine wood nematode) hypothetical protein n=1 Tax=Bursaphelenchus xylophilus TaxID=6326 RepID=A0A1I7SCB4_BURXY|nr:unnamed protein product [Bursaphelenchus xylophilus]CAG9094419.1 unnamed protein product [Bursaphelenchus xylophilus]